MTTRHNVLCQCGWGMLAIPEHEIPSHCPMCDFDLASFADSQQLAAEEAFDAWMREVDTILAGWCGGLQSTDFADFLTRDAFDNDATPEDTAREILANDDVGQMFLSYITP